MVQILLQFHVFHCILPPLEALLVIITFASFYKNNRSKSPKSYEMIRALLRENVPLSKGRKKTKSNEISIIIFLLMGTVMWQNTELKICHLSLEAVKGHSLNKICNNQGKRNFPTLKYNRAFC